MQYDAIVNVTVDVLDDEPMPESPLKYNFMAALTKRLADNLEGLALEARAMEYQSAAMLETMFRGLPWWKRKLVMWCLK